MSNSRSPRAVRSMTIGTRGMARRYLRDSAGRGRGAGAGAQAPEQALDAPADLARGPAAACRRRRRAGCRRRASRAARGPRGRRGAPRRRAARARPAAARSPPRATTRIASNSVARVGAPCRPARRRPRRAPAARARVRLGRVEDRRTGASGSALQPPAQREAVAVEQVCSSSTTSGCRRSTSSHAVVGAVRGADRDEPRLGAQQHARPARTAGWGSTTLCGSRPGPFHRGLKWA